VVKVVLKGLLSGLDLLLIHVSPSISQVNKGSSSSLYWYKPYKSISIFYSLPQII
jgi:hypothetical protein